MSPADYNDESYINDLVDRYKSTGDIALRDQLLKAFDPFFKKYASLLCSSKPVDLSNKDTIRFLRLYMSPTDRIDDRSVIKAAYRTVTYLRNLFKTLEFNDIYNEVICIFLDQLSRYKMMIANHKHDKPRISFTHFIQVNVRFKMKALTIPREKDALSCLFNVEFNDELDQNYCNPAVGFNWNAIDLRWVRGDTTGTLFKQLTEIERYLLYLKYETKEKKPLSDYELARLTGMDRMYVRRKMLKLKDRIKDLALHMA